jgi:hypothetical protein
VSGEGQREFALGDLLCLSHGLQASIDQGSIDLIDHMTYGYVNPHFVQETCAFLGQILRQRHPWLAGIRLPTAIGRSDWAMFWAWMDTLERRFGEHHVVEPLTDSELRRLWACTQVIFEDGPPTFDGGH